MDTAEPTGRAAESLSAEWLRVTNDTPAAGIRGSVRCLFFAAGPWCTKPAPQALLLWLATHGIATITSGCWTLDEFVVQDKCTPERKLCAWGLPGVTSEHSSKEARGLSARGFQGGCRRGPWSL